jgi:hypothetical protein
MQPERAFRTKPSKGDKFFESQERQKDWFAAYVKYNLWPTVRRGFWKAIYFLYDLAKTIVLSIWTFIYLSLPNKRVKKLLAILREVHGLTFKTDEAIQKYKKLAEIALQKSIEEKNRQEVVDRIWAQELSLRERKKEIQWLINLIENSAFYLKRRQQKASIKKADEVGVDRGRENLDFQKAQETWETHLKEIKEITSREMEFLGTDELSQRYQKHNGDLKELEEDLAKWADFLKDALEQCNDLSTVFIPEDGNLIPLEEWALEIDELAGRHEARKESLGDLEEDLDTKVASIEKFEELDEALSEAADHWSHLRHKDLRGILDTCYELDKVCANISMDLLNQARIILSLGEDVFWLETKVEKANELFNIILEKDKSWKIALRLIDKEIPEAWASRQDVNELIAEVKNLFFERKQKLATRAFDLARDLKLQAAGEDAVSAANTFGQQITQGRQVEQVSTWQPSKSEPVLMRGRRVVSELGTEMPEHLRETWEGKKQETKDG